MALPDISGLRDNITTISGLTIGSSVWHIYEANGNSLEWIYQIPTFVYNNASCTYYRLTVGNDHDAGVASMGTDFIKADDFIGNKVGVMCYQDFECDGYRNCWIPPYVSRYNNPTAVDRVINTGSAPNKLNAQRVILESDSKEKYIGVPLIVAKNENGQSCPTSEFETYKNTYMENYPYITNIVIRYYYKSNLDIATVTQVNLSFALPRTKLTTKYLYFTPSQAGYPHYGVMNKGDSLITNFGSVIFRAPSITSAVYNGRYTCALDETMGTHGSIYHLTTGDVANNIRPFLYIDINQAVNIINSTGMWWAESLDHVKYDAKGQDTTSDSVHAPKVTAGGATTTEDYHGTEISNHWTENGYRNLGGISLTYTQNVNPYEPEDRTDEATEDPDPLPNESTELELDTPQYTGVGCFSTYYCMTMGQIRRFNDDMWTSDETWLTSVIEGLRFWGSNPMEAIMSLRLYPFDIKDYVQTGSPVNIKLGRNVMPTAKGEILSANSTVLLDLGSMFIKPVFNDFRDFAPYTQMHLYVPFVGTITLNPNEFMYHIMNIKMVIDLTTGTCEVCVYADSRPMVYQTGTIAVDIPISLDTMSNLSSAIFSSILSMTGTAILNGAEGLISEGASFSHGRITAEEDTSDVMAPKIGTETISNLAGQVFAGGSTISQSGKATPACCMANPLYPYLVVSTPMWERPENFDHTYGKICHTSGVLSNYYGYTICINVDTSSIQCTKMEQNLIKSLLESGVFL